MQLDKKVTSFSPSLPGQVKLGAKASPAAWETRPRLLCAQLFSSPRTTPCQRSQAYLTGSCRRLNQLQQLAIRLNIPGRCPLRLPSEPGEGMGP